MVGDISFYPQQERVYKKRRANLEKAVKDGVLSLSINGQPPHPTAPTVPPPPDISNLPAAVEQLSQQVTNVANSVSQTNTKLEETKQALQGTQTLIGQINTSVQEAKASVTTVQGNLDQTNTKIDQVKTEINQIKSDVDTLKANQGSGGGGGSSGGSGSGSGTPPPINAKVDPSPNSIPQRTATGALKVNTAVEENEATTLKQVTEHVDSKVQGLKTTLTQDIQTVKTESIQAAENKVQALIDGAPAELDTLKELADALKEDKTGIRAINTALTERYTKSETNAKIDEKADAKIDKLFEGITDEDYKTIPKIVQKVKGHDAKLGVIDQTLPTLATKDSVTQGIAQLKTELVDGAADGFSTLKKVETKFTSLQGDVEGLKGSLGQKCPVNPEFCYDTLVASKQEIFKVDDKELTKGGVEIIDLSAYKGITIYIEVQSKRTPDADDPCFAEIQMLAGDKTIFDTKSEFDVENTSDPNAPVTKTYKVVLPWRQGAIKLKGFGLSSNASLTVKASIRIEKDAAGVVIDGTGQQAHGATEAGVTSLKDTTVGAFFHFFKNKMSHPPIKFTNDMAWSHSRWFRIDGVQESKDDCFMWEYGDADFAFCNRRIGNMSAKFVRLFSRLRVLKDGRVQDCRYNCGSLNNLELNKWYHLVVMHQLTKTSFQTFAFLNNKKVIEKAETDLKVSNQPLAVNFYEMGRHRLDKVSFMYGDQANILFFKRLLSPEEIAWLYSNPVYFPKSYSLTDYTLDEYMKSHP